MAFVGDGTLALEPEGMAIAEELQGLQEWNADDVIQALCNVQGAYVTMFWDSSFGFCIFCIGLYLALGIVINILV